VRAAELLKESGELKHKVRTVSDLVIIWQHVRKVTPIIVFF